MGGNAGQTDGAMVDRAWRGYDPRAMVPWLALAAALSAVLLSGRWYIRDLSELADRAGALAVYGMALAVWPGLLAVLLYRAVTYTYRLTDRALLLDRGPLARPQPPVPLGELAGAAAEVGWLGRRLGVGRVILKTQDGRAVRLTGVRDPQRFVEAVRAAAAEAKAAAQPATA